MEMLSKPPLLFLHFFTWRQDETSADAFTEFHQSSLLRLELILGKVGELIESIGPRIVSIQSSFILRLDKVFCFLKSSRSLGHLHGVGDIREMEVVQGLVLGVVVLVIEIYVGFFPTVNSGQRYQEGQEDWDGFILVI